MLTLVKICNVVWQSVLKMLSAIIMFLKLNVAIYELENVFKNSVFSDI